MSSPSLVRILYRGLMRGTRRLETQLARHGKYVFTEAECSRLKELFPGYKKAIIAPGARAAMNRLLGDEFRAGAALDAKEDADEIGRRLDDSIAGFSLLSRRLSLLEAMAADTKSDTVTEGIRVTAKSDLIPELSSAREGRYLFKYSINIINEGRDEPVQLVSRHWETVDEDGKVEETRGHGVVGRQPVLDQGADFNYDSQVPLRTLKGSMKGSYMVVGQKSGKLFEATVGPFALKVPRGEAGEGSKRKGRRKGGGGGVREKNKTGEDEEVAAVSTE